MPTINLNELVPSKTIKPFNPTAHYFINPNDESKFDNGWNPENNLDPTSDLEDFRGDHKRWYDYTGDFMMRVPALTGAKLVTGIGLVGGGVKGLITGEGFFHEAYNNELTKAGEWLEEEINKQYPIYQTHENEAMNPFRKIFTPEWLSEQGADMAAFSLATMIPALGLGKFANLGMEAVGASDAVWLAKLGKFGMQSTKFRQSVGLGLSSALSSSTEALFESKSIYDNAIKEGKTEEQAIDISRKSYLANVAILSISNTWELKQILGGYNNTRKLAKGLLDMDGNVIRNSWKQSFKEVAKNAGKGVLVEGAWEENVQHAIEKWSNDVTKGQADGDWISGLNEIGANYFNNFTDKEGLENILGGAVMGVVMGGGVGSYNDIKSKNALANQFSKNFKDSSKEYNIEKYREDVAKLKQEYGEQKKLQTDINKVKGNKEFVESISKILNLSKSQDLQDYLATLDLEELYNYTRDTALAKLSHNYITSGMSQHLINKMEAAKELTDTDKQVFGNIADVNDPAKLKKHIDYLVGKVQDYEKTYDKVDNMFGWQTHETEDAEKNKLKVRLFDTGNIYMNTIRRDNAVERISALNLKQLELEGRFLSTNILDNLGELDAPLPTTLETTKKLASEGNLDAIDYLKNNAQIKVLKNQYADAVKKLTDLTNGKKSRETIDNLKKDGEKDVEEAIANPNKFSDPFQAKITHLSEINATGKLFYNGKPGTLNVQQEKGKVWFNADDKSPGIQVTEKNIDEFINQAKTPEQLEEDKQFEIEKNAQVAKIKALDELVQHDTKELTDWQKELGNVDEELLKHLIDIEEAAKLLKTIDKITKAAKEIKALIAKSEKFVAGLEELKTEIEQRITKLQKSIEFLNNEIKQAIENYEDIETQGFNLLQEAEKFDNKTIAEVEKLIFDTQSLVNDLDENVGTLKYHLKVLKDKFDELMKTNDAARIIYKAYNRQFKNKYPGVFKIANLDTINEITEEGVRGKFTDNFYKFSEFSSYDELHDFINNNPDFIKDFTQILRNKKQLDENVTNINFLKDHIILTEDQLGELLPELNAYKQALEEYKAERDIISRAENFFINYKRLSSKFKSILEKLNKDTISKYNSYLGISDDDFNENSEQTPKKAEDAILDSFNYGRKDTLFTTSGRDNPRTDRVITQLDFEKYHYHLKIIAVDSEENYKNYEDVEKEDLTQDGKILKGERAINEYYKQQAEAKGEKWHPLKAVLIYGNGNGNDNDVLADEKGDLSKTGKPVTFYLHTENYVDRLDKINLTINWLGAFNIYLTKEQLEQDQLKNLEDKVVIDGITFTSAKDLIDYVVKAHKEELTKLRETMYTQLKEGKTVFLEANDKSNGVQIKSSLKPVIGAFVKDLNDLDRIIIPYETTSNRAKNGYVRVEISNGVTRFFKVGVPVLVNSKNQIIVAKNTTLSANDADFIIQLLDRALGNPSNKKVTMDGTDGEKYYILPNKSSQESIISKLILWNSDPKKGLEYHISYHKGKIYYGYDEANKAPYMITTKDLLNNPSINHFKDWLMTKRLNVNKKSLSLDTYSHPVGLTEDGKVEMQVFTRKTEGKRLGAYERMLIEENKLLTDLPLLGENQFKSVYLKYDKTIKNTLVVKAPVKPKEEVKPGPQFDAKKPADSGTAKTDAEIKEEFLNSPSKSPEEKKSDMDKFNAALGIESEGSTDISELSSLSAMLAEASNPAEVTPDNLTFANSSESNNESNGVGDEDSDIMNSPPQDVDNAADQIGKNCKTK